MKVHAMRGEMAERDTYRKSPIDTNIPNEIWEMIGKSVNLLIN